MKRNKIYKILLNSKIKQSIIKNSICIPLYITMIYCLVYLFNDEYMNIQELITLMALNCSTLQLEERLSSNNGINLITDFHNTEEYKQLMEKYNYFINEFASFLKKYKIEDPLILDILVTNLLQEGYFSITGYFHYDEKLGEYKEDKIFETNLGSRIFTGNGVCRHQATFLKDINETYGFNSVPILNKMLPKKESMKKRAIKSLFSEDHLITGVESNKGKFIIDPTNNIVGEYINNKEVKTIKPTGISYSLCEDFYDTDSINNVIDSNKITVFNSKENRHIDTDELKKAKKEAINIVEENRDKFKKFRHDNAKIMMEIAQLHCLIVQKANETKTVSKVKLLNHAFYMNKKPTK